MLARLASRPGEADFRTLAENIPDVVARLDAQLRYLYVNRALETAFARHAGDFIGRRHDEVDLPLAIRAPMEEAIRDAFATGRLQSFGMPVDNGGDKHHFSGRVIPEI